MRWVLYRSVSSPPDEISTDSLYLCLQREIIKGYLYTESLESDDSETIKAITECAEQTRNYLREIGKLLLSRTGILE